MEFLLSKQPQHQRGRFIAGLRERQFPWLESWLRSPTHHAPAALSSLVFLSPALSPPPLPQHPLPINPLQSRSYPHRLLEGFPQPQTTYVIFHTHSSKAPYHACETLSSVSLLTLPLSTQPKFFTRSLALFSFCCLSLLCPWRSHALQRLLSQP